MLGLKFHNQLHLYSRSAVLVPSTIPVHYQFSIVWVGTVRYTPRIEIVFDPFFSFFIMVPLETGQYRSA